MPASLHDQLLVQRLDEAQVDERGVELLGDALARRNHRADGDDREAAAAFTAHLRLADRQRASSSASMATPGPWPRG